ncbi:MAG: Arc family DNA-binding protein [Patescibacteria group bacterium]
MANANGQKRFLLRVESGLYDALQRLARDEYRSVNGLIEWMLADALRKRGRLPQSRVPKG